MRRPVSLSSSQMPGVTPPRVCSTVWPKAPGQMGDGEVHGDDNRVDITGGDRLARLERQADRLERMIDDLRQALSAPGPLTRFDQDGAPPR